MDLQIPLERYFIILVFSRNCEQCSTVKFLNLRWIHTEKKLWGKATEELYLTKSPIAYTFKFRNLTTEPLKLVIVGMCFAHENSQLARTSIKTICAITLAIIHFVLLANIPSPV